MATNFATDIRYSELAERKARLSLEHRFFLTVAVLFPLITVIGFAPSYYFKTLFNAPPLPSLLVHVHGLTMSLWVILFSVQASLISARRIKLHIALGTFGVILAGAVVVTGMMTGYALLVRGGAFPGYSPTAWFMIPAGDMAAFVLLFAAAIYYRKVPANHKRLMFVTVLNFLPPSIGRLPFPFILDLGTIWFFGVPALIGLAVLAADSYRNNRVNRPFAIAVTLLTISGPVRMAIAYSDTWTRFAHWIAGQNG